MPFGKIGFSKALLNKWIRLDKTSEGGPKILKNVCITYETKCYNYLYFRYFSSCLLGMVCIGLQVKNIEDHIREKLLLVMKGSANELNEKDKTELKKRTLLSEA